jgi:hypothetical protein
MDFPKFDPQQGWTFEERGHNQGQDCAANGRGTARIMDDSRAILQNRGVLTRSVEARATGGNVRRSELRFDGRPMAKPSLLSPSSSAGTTSPVSEARYEYS